MRLNIKNIYKPILFFMSCWLMTFFLIGEPLKAQDNNKLTDTQIEQATVRELIFHDEVASHLINIDAKKGIVTLTGIADNLCAKKRAKNIALAVKGVKAVVNNIEITETNRTDSEIRSDVEDAFLYDPATESYEIDPTVNAGVVTLTGKVQSWQEKRLATKVAASVKGVREVKNNLGVDFMEDRTDHDIEQDIKQSLHWDVRVDDGLITVNVDNGKVTLSGVVGSAVEKNHATINAWVNGVKSVDNEKLTINHLMKDKELRKGKYDEKTDDEIRVAVKRAFMHDPRLKFFEPKVEVDDGKIILNGTVDNLKAKRVAEQDARNVVGVWTVKNHLKVRPDKMPTDNEITKNIQDVLLWDPYIERYDITVVSENGEVSVYGVVDSHYEKHRAEDIISGIKGVIDINNYLHTNHKSNSAYYGFVYDWNVLPPVEVIPIASDATIKDNIQDQIWWSPYIELAEIDVEVNNGKATLTGDVDSWLEWHYATINAFEGGALQVDNNLNVKKQ